MWLFYGAWETTHYSKHYKMTVSTTLLPHCSWLWRYLDRKNSQDLSKHDDDDHPQTIVYWVKSISPVTWKKLSNRETECGKIVLCTRNLIKWSRIERPGSSPHLSIIWELKHNSCKRNKKFKMYSCSIQCKIQWRLGGIDRFYTSGVFGKLEFEMKRTVTVTAR